MKPNSWQRALKQHMENFMVDQFNEALFECWNRNNLQPVTLADVARELGMSVDAGTLSSRSRVWTECRKRGRKSGMLVDSRGGRPRDRRRG